MTRRAMRRTESGRRAVPGGLGSAAAVLELFAAVQQVWPSVEWWDGARAGSRFPALLLAQPGLSLCSSTTALKATRSPS